MDCENVTDDAKSKLRTFHEILNPFDLKQQIDAKLRNIFSMLKVTSVMRHVPDIGYPFFMRQHGSVIKSYEIYYVE